MSRYQPSLKQVYIDVSSCDTPPSHYFIFITCTLLADSLVPVQLLETYSQIYRVVVNLCMCDKITWTVADLLAQAGTQTHYLC